jgi:hypothetical protein
VPEHLETQLFAEIGFETMLARQVRRNLALRLRDVLHHPHVLEEIDRARLGVVLRFELSGWTECRLRRLENGRLHRLDQDGLVDAFLLGDLIDDQAQIAYQVRSLCCHGST